MSLTDDLSNNKVKYTTSGTRFCSTYYSLFHLIKCEIKDTVEAVHLIWLNVLSFHHTWCIFISKYKHINKQQYFTDNHYQ